jgi:hypothetical protein
MSRGITNEYLMQTLRMQAWERAKGELRAVLHTYYGDASARDSDHKFEKANARIESFISDIEENGIVE